MGYRKYSRTDLRKLNQQHNIMALVGNGFDIQVLRDYGGPSDTRYETFYSYLNYRNFDRSNLIYEKMGDLRKIGEHNWSDLEFGINRMVMEDKVNPGEVFESLQDIQREFSIFLNEVASSELLNKLGDKVMTDELSVRSLSGFMYDIPNEESYRRLRFPQNTDHYDLFNFLFINLNYTALLDGYTYLDQNQFDPRPHKTVDTNFRFYPNPRGFKYGSHNDGTRWSTYVASEVVHPHGYQDIPRSLLFGIDGMGTSPAQTNSLSKLEKAYWAQSESKFQHLFLETRLFIIFGCSLGQTDGWWWRNICQTLKSNPDSELIIYWWYQIGNKPSEDLIRQKFIDVANETDRSVAEKIHVIVYSNHDKRIWLSTQKYDSLSFL